MTYSNARLVLGNTSFLVELVDMIRNNDIRRDDAYDYFLKLHHTGIIKGLGPAFYTKLLYYFGKNNGWSAYIMDQWTSLSINYLTGHNIVQLNSVRNGNRTSNYVSKYNDWRVYSNFNNLVEILAKKLTALDPNKKIYSGEETEIFIFSEGYKKGAWRNHLVNSIEGNIV
jgi:hypothetical protein